MTKSETKYFNTAAKMDMALISLLEKKDFDFITVSEICKTAHVNRSTFYLHYENTCDLLQETVKYLVDDFTRRFTESPVKDISNILTKSADDLIYISDRYMLPFLTYIKENKKVFGVVMSLKTVFGFEDIYKRMFDGIFNPILEKFRYNPDYRSYVMRYYLNGIMAIIVEWLENDCDKSEEEIAEIIKLCIYGNNCKI